MAERPTDAHIHIDARLDTILPAAVVCALASIWEASALIIPLIIIVMEISRQSENVDKIFKNHISHYLFKQLTIIISMDPQPQIFNRGIRQHSF